MPNTTTGSRHRSVSKGSRSPGMSRQTLNGAADERLCQRMPAYTAISTQTARAVCETTAGFGEGAGDPLVESSTGLKQTDSNATGESRPRSETERPMRPQPPLRREQYSISTSRSRPSRTSGRQAGSRVSSHRFWDRARSRRTSLRRSTGRDSKTTRSVSRVIVSVWLSSVMVLFFPCSC